MIVFDVELPLNGVVAVIWGLLLPGGKSDMSVVFFREPLC